MRRWAEAGSDATIIEGQPGCPRCILVPFSHSWVTDETKVKNQARLPSIQALNLSPAAGGPRFVPPSVRPASTFVRLQIRQPQAHSRSAPRAIDPGSQLPSKASTIPHRRRFPRTVAPPPHYHLHISTTRPPQRVLRRTRLLAAAFARGTATPARPLSPRARIPRAAFRVQDLFRDPEPLPFFSL
jgi:hypothetical protein